MKTTSYVKLAFALAGITMVFARQLVAQGVIESWVQRYNGPGNGADYARAMTVDSDGNVYVTGHSLGSGSSFDFATIKYSSNGVPLWTNRYNGPGNDHDQANVVAVHTNARVYVAGYSRSAASSASEDYATVAYTSTGTPLWTNRYNGPGNEGDRVLGIAVDSNGNVCVAGYSFGSGSSFDFATIKYSGDGVPLWTNRYNGPGNSSDGANAVAVDAGDNVLVTGYSLDGSLQSDYATIKYSSAGVPLWTNRYSGHSGSSSSDIANTVAVDSSGNVYVAGYSFAIGSENDYATVAYSSAGVALWTNRYNGPGNGEDQALAIAVDGSNNIYVTGFSAGNGSAFDYATIAYSSAGVALWTNRYNGPANASEIANAVVAEANGNIVVTGYSYNGTSFDYATIAYSSAGVPLWTNLYNGPGNQHDEARTIAVSGNGNVFVTGFSVGTNSDYDFATIKYSPVFAPQITVQLQSIANIAGATASFTISATGTEPLHYQWRHDGTNLLDGGNVSGATTNQLVLTDIQPTDAGSYDVVVTNLYGAVTSLVATLTVQSCVTPPAGLVSWWRGERNLLDSIGANSATENSGVSFVPGKNGQAINFNGSGSFASVPDAYSLKPTNEFSIEVWLRSSGTPPYSGIVIKFDEFPFNTGFELTFQGNGQKLTGIVGVGGGAYTGFSNPQTVTDGQWHHAVATFSSSALILYIDGVAGDPVTPTGFAPVSQSQLALGNDPCCGGRNFTGDLDEIRFYNRALTSNEIAAIYAAGSAGMCPQSPPAPHLVWIPPGTFTMGSATDEPASTPNEGPQTQVLLTRGFWMSKYEVTQGEYQSLMSSNPSHFPGDTNRPVERVSWQQALQYCSLLTQTERAAGRLPDGYVYRLPTEAEWEYACRAGTTNRFSFGDNPADLGNYGWFIGNSGCDYINDPTCTNTGTTHPVGQKLPNPWGLYDMHGNVGELALDYLGQDLPGGSITNPVGGIGTTVIFRAPAWDFGNIYTASATRWSYQPGWADDSIGFRVVLAESDLYYSTGFESSIGPEWSHTNTSVTPVGARRFLGQLTNQTVTLTLTNLPPHTFARVNFSLFIISSWDGNNTTYGPDRWTMQVSNGPVLIDTTFSVVFSEDQAFPGSYGNGSFPAGTGAAETNTLGFPGLADRFGDTLYHLSPSLVHTNATLTISFTFAPRAGTYSGLPDDNWGLDDVSVELFNYGPGDLQNLYLAPMPTLYSNSTNGYQAVLFANYPSLTNLDVTALAAWSSSNPSIFTVDAAGRLFPHNPGDALLIASYQNLAATTSVSVVYVAPLVSHTVSTAVGNGADIEVREISGIGLDNSSLGSHPYANARYSTTSQLRNEVIALRFDLAGYDLAQIQNVRLDLVNYRDNAGTRVLHYYGVKAGAVGLDNNTNAYYYTNGLSPHYTAENWDESQGGPDGTNLLVFSTMPGLVFDGDGNTRSLSVTDLVDLGAQATSSNSKGTITTFTSSALVSNLTVFLQNHTSPLVTILVGRDTDVTTQDRFASKEATALDGGTPTGAAGDFAPRLVFDAPATAIPATLNIQLIGTSVVLTWTNAGFQLQAAPTIISPFTNIPAATNPYTNPATGDNRYFRLKQG